MNKRSRPRPQAKGQPAPRPRLAWPPAPPQGKPTYYRLRVNAMDSTRPRVDNLVGDFDRLDTIVERGSLGECEGAAVRLATFGRVGLRPDGKRQWYRPELILIEPIEEKAEEHDHAG